MATSTPLADPAKASSKTRAPLRHLPLSPLTYWHLLSLDAPTVAMLWTWFIARASGIHLPIASIVAMGISVWTLYAADRLLDSATGQDLEPRHIFHRRHQRRFVTAVVLAVIVLVLLIPKLPPPSLLLYAILGALLTAYFLLIHLRHKPVPRLPKEIAVGIFFSAATFIPTVARNPALRSRLFPAAILFGLVCSLNCLFIYAWEHASPYPEAHPVTRLSLRFLPQLAAVAIFVCPSLLLSASPTSRPLFAATAAATTLLLLLHRSRGHLSPTTLRAAADLCLLTPLLFTLK